MRTVFVKSLNFSQVKDSDAQIDTIHWYIAEINPVLIRWWGWYAILLLCWSIRCLVTLLSYTHRYYIVVVKSFLLQCWAIPNPNTMVSLIRSFCIAEKFPFSMPRWAISNPNTLVRYTLSFHIAELFLKL